MCFSPQADVVGGVIVTAIGIDALRHATLPKERLLASIPFVLAAHSFIETFVWLGLRGELSANLGRVMTWIYLVIAFGVIPVLVPIAVAALEPNPVNPRTVAFTTLGVGVAGVLLYSVIRGPVTATIEGHHISYDVALNRGGLLVALYVVATCGSLLASRHRHVQRFGTVNLLAVGALIVIDQTAFVSLWCAWAAVTSVCIALHLRRAEGIRVLADASAPAAA
jgi:hypothetical protein